MFWRPFALACLLGTAAPADPPEPVADPVQCPGVCEAPVHYSVDPAFDASERALILEAMHVWEAGTRGRVCFFPGGQDLVIERLEGAEGLQPMDPDWAKHVALTKGNHVWIVEDTVPEPGGFRALAAHEIGHYLGLGHVEDTRLTFMHSAIGDTPQELLDDASLPERDRRSFCEEHVCTCAK